MRDWDPVKHLIDLWSFFVKIINGQKHKYTTELFSPRTRKCGTEKLYHQSGKCSAYSVLLLYITIFQIVIILLLLLFQITFVEP